MSEPTPPYTTDSTPTCTDRATQEEHLLGAILIDAVYYAHLRQTVAPAHFQDKRNRLVWEAFERLYASHTAILFRSVCQELAQAGTLQAAGGPMRLGALVNNTPRDANPVALAQFLTGQAATSPSPVPQPLTPAEQIAGRIKGLLLRLPVGTPSVEVLYAAHDELLRLSEIETLVRKWFAIWNKIGDPATGFEAAIDLSQDAAEIQTRLRELLALHQGR